MIADRNAVNLLLSLFLHLLQFQPFRDRIKTLKIDVVHRLAKVVDSPEVRTFFYCR